MGPHGGNARRFPAFGVVVVLVCLGGGECAPSLDDVPRPSGRVLMVGLDGATWDLIDPLIAQGRLPHFAKLDLNLVFFKGIDPVCHLGWIFAFPRGFDPRFRPAPAALARYGETIHRYYEFMDEAIGALMAAAPANTDVVIVSDHGFGGKEEAKGDVAYNLNPLLARSGFIVTDAAGHPDVERSVLFDPTAIWNEGRTRRKLRVNPETAAGREVDELLSKLRSLRTPGGLPIFADVRPGGPEEIDVVLDPRLEPLADHPDGSGLVMRRLGYSGGHRPEGIVLMAGPHVRAGARFGSANLYDVAPTVLRLLKLPGARDMKGRVLEEGLRLDRLGAALPPVESYETGDPIERLESPPLPEEVSQEFRERLRALGYIR